MNKCSSRKASRHRDFGYTVMSARQEGGCSNVEENELNRTANPRSPQVPAVHPPPVYRLQPGSPVPVGYRFKPSSEELVSHFLRRKIDRHPSPPLIPELDDVFGTEPWNLPGDEEEDRYFFSRIKNEANSGDSSGVRKRVVGASGYWKQTGIQKQIVTPTLKAIKSSLLFCRGGRGEEQEDEGEEEEREEGSTDVAQAQPKWIMHEFRPQNQENRVEGDRWAVYRVFRKRHGPKDGAIILRSNLRDFFHPRPDRT